MQEAPRWCSTSVRGASPRIVGYSGRSYDHTASAYRVGHLAVRPSNAAFRVAERVTTSLCLRCHRQTTSLSFRRRAPMCLGSLLVVSLFVTCFALCRCDNRQTEFFASAVELGLTPCSSGDWLIRPHSISTVCLLTFVKRLSLFFISPFWLRAPSEFFQEPSVLQSLICLSFC